jgi:DnaJ-domain-containing protein 1
MTELLRRVVAEIERLPAEEQDAIAERLQREMEEREWAERVAKPGSQRFLEALAAEARREDASGEAKESGERW